MISYLSWRYAYKGDKLNMLRDECDLLRAELAALYAYLGVERCNGGEFRKIPRVAA